MESAMYDDGTESGRCRTRIMTRMRSSELFRQHEGDAGRWGRGETFVMREWSLEVRLGELEV